MSQCVGSVAILLSIVAMRSVAPQAVALVRGGCSSCDIEARVVARLGRGNEQHAIVLNSQVTRIGSNRYLVAPTSTPGVLAIFDRSGRLEAAVGRRGGGPGEFSEQLGPVVSTDGGGVLVVDYGNGRAALVDSTGRTTGYIRLLHQVFGAAVGGSQLYLNMLIRTPERFGSAIHRMKRTGEIVASFGEIGTVSPVTATARAVRTMGASAAGQLWYAPVDEYVLTKADTSGRTRVVLTKPLRGEVGSGGMLTFAVASLREDARGLLWASTLSRTSAARSARSEKLVEEVVRDGVISTVEVIDPSRGRVLAMHRLDGAPLLFIADGVAYRHQLGADGSLAIDIVALKFKEPHPETRR